jgi:hypothetical protein
VTAGPSIQTAGVPITIAVTALDASNHPDALFQGSLHFITSDPQVAPFDMPFAGGTATATFTITMKTAGRQTIIVTDTDRPAIKGATVAGIRAAGVSTLGVTGFPSPTLTGAAHSFTVTALDVFGNRVTGYLGMVGFRVTGATQTVPPALPTAYTFAPVDQGAHLFTATMNAVGVLSLTATDSLDSNITGSRQINVATLTAGISGPPGGVGVRGQPLNLTLTANEDGVPANTSFTYRIDWDGNGTVDKIVSGTSPTTISHVYLANGIDNITVTAVDGAGNVSPHAAVQTISVQSLAIEPDPADGTRSALVIGGTTGDDIITISPADPSGLTVMVSINGESAAGPYAPTGHLLVYGQSGNDIIQEVAKVINNQTVMIAVPALLFGGSGHTTLSAAGNSANNVLVGGTGDISLFGGSGRDILIGGAGAAILHAGSGDDILIAGSTIYDANLPALLALMAEWGSGDTYQQRVLDLFGDGAGGHNGSYLLDPQTVVRDTAVSQLFGGSALDWFWFSQSKKARDQINKYADGEVATFE